MDEKEKEPHDWQMKFIGEDQRHRDTREALLIANARAEAWRIAYFSLVKVLLKEEEN